MNPARVMFVSLAFPLLLSACVAAKIDINPGYLAQARELTRLAKMNLASPPKAARSRGPASLARPDAATLVQKTLADAKLAGKLGGVREDLVAGLARNGFLKLDPASEREIPPGAVVVYFGGPVHCELKGADGLYYGAQARRGSAWAYGAPFYVFAKPAP